jgi:polyhydroxyalkanoate synthesis repressor PhaR
MASLYRQCDRSAELPAVGLDDARRHLRSRGRRCSYFDVSSTEAPAEPRPSDTRPSDTGTRRVIKRYSNRKLYDTRDSRYVTLQQIGEMVRAGEEVQIIDNKTKEDKTEVTLALILSEDLKAQPRSIPLAALRDLIQERGGKLLTQLREGPIGRLLPGSSPASDEGAATPEAPVESEPPLAAAPAASLESEPPKPSSDERKGRLTELMESSLSTLDDRIRTLVPTAKAFAELRDELQRLNDRVERLEKALDDARRR